MVGVHGEGAGLAALPQVHSQRGGAQPHRGGERGAANAEPRPLDEVRLRHHLAIDVADAAEGTGMGGRDLDPHPAEPGNPGRHQSLATGLVHRAARALDHDGAATGQRGEDGHREPGRPAADDRVVHAVLHHRRSSSSEQKPGPIAVISL